VGGDAGGGEWRFRPAAGAVYGTANHFWEIDRHSARLAHYLSMQRMKGDREYSGPMTLMILDVMNLSLTGVRTNEFHRKIP